MILSIVTHRAGFLAGFLPGGVLEWAQRFQKQTVH